MMVSLWYPAWPGTALIDPSRIAMAGHSIGAAAIAALVADARIRVGIDTGAGLSGARSLDITRTYVRAFFDQHLRDKPQPLLDEPSPRYPEVTFCAPKEELRRRRPLGRAASAIELVVAPPPPRT